MQPLRTPRFSKLYRFAFTLAVAGLAATSVIAAQETSAPSTASVILLSDLHFDPYFDPAKFEKLRTSGAAQWNTIFAEPNSATQAATLAQLNRSCNFTRGADTNWPLLQSSLTAAHAHAAHAAFVTVSGDLMAHEFDCRFKVLAPKSTEADYAAFAFKTVAYLALELRRTFRGIPVYVALGNNDSGCGDYKESSGSVFLRALTQSLAGEFTAPADRVALAKQFPASGSYSVPLPAPIARGRLLVLQDMFQARTYTGCDGKPDPGAAEAQIAWLRAELTAARAQHEQVWVMAHIPPGPDVYSTISHRIDVCAGNPPTMFLANEKMVEVLTDFADIMRLSIFAHTHLDEMKLLGGKVPAKIVPSISPINGNNPAFLLADVDTQTASLRDYRVIAGSNRSGLDTKWADEYRFSTTYHAKSYTTPELTPLLTAMQDDRQGIAQASTDYQQNAFTGGGKGTLAIHFLWPGYACSMTNNTAAGYRDCVCRKAPQP